MKFAFRLFAVLALLLVSSVASAAGPILFDCNEVIQIQGEYYTQPVCINLDRVIAMKAGKVLGERVTMIRLDNYIPNQFVWMHIEGSFEDVKAEMRAVIQGSSSLDNGGFKPLPQEAIQSGVRSATAVPDGAVPLPR